MKRTIVDTSNLTLEDKVVAIKRVTKVVKGISRVPIRSDSVRVFFVAISS